ncbi:MAG: hypothetical protein MK085_05695 [Phycisphaerales bacterium]|nr:hypothetical protein [Phycisphaerales bacterium]
MTFLWPYFHDPAFKPTPRERFALHWEANLMMLKSFRAVAIFLVITLAPIILVVILFELFGPLSFNIAAGQPNLTAIIAAQIGLLLAFLCVQHVAFVAAMSLTYVPFVRQAIRNQGTPICIQCGHLLATLSSQCSECGESDTIEQGP